MKKKKCPNRKPIHGCVFGGRCHNLIEADQANNRIRCTSLKVDFRVHLHQDSSGDLLYKEKNHSYICFTFYAFNSNHKHNKGIYMRL